MVGIPRRAGQRLRKRLTLPSRHYQSPSSNMNVNEPNNAAPAKFSVFLSQRKGLIPSGLAKELKGYFADCERVSAERLKYTSEMAEAKIRAIMAAAEDNPTSANLEAVSQLNPDGVRHSFAETLNAVATIYGKALARSVPLIKRLRDEVLPVADAEIASLESQGRALAEKYGATYAPQNDGVLNSLRKWRKVAETQLSNESGLHPDQIVSLVGEIK